MIIKRLLFLILILYSVSVAYAGFFSPEDEKISLYASSEQLKKAALKEKSPIWKLSLGQHIIEQMTILTENIALLELKNYSNELVKDHIKIVDINRGKQIWSYALTADANTFNIISRTNNIIVVEFIYENKVEISAIDFHTGKTQWNKTFPKKTNIFLKK